MTQEQNTIPSDNASGSVPSTNTCACDTASAACACQGADETACVRPRHAITESEGAWKLIAHLPGVAKNDLSITEEAGLLVIRGERAWKRPDSWEAIYRETDGAAFELTLEHDGQIDVEKIHADFADGVLTLSLPKIEAVKPRKITVN